MLYHPIHVSAGHDPHAAAFNRCVVERDPARDQRCNLMAAALSFEVSVVLVPINFATISWWLVQSLAQDNFEVLRDEVGDCVRDARVAN